jgi:hypothetical protein
VILLSLEGGDLEIKAGVAIANIDPTVYHANESINEDLTCRHTENTIVFDHNRVELES